MPYIDIDIDVDDFYDELNRCEKEELIELLEQDGFLEKKQVFRASEDAMASTVILWTTNGQK